MDSWDNIETVQLMSAQSRAVSDGLQHALRQLCRVCCTPKDQFQQDWSQNFVQ